MAQDIYKKKYEIISQKKNYFTNDGFPFVKAQRERREYIGKNTLCLKGFEIVVRQNCTGLFSFPPDTCAHWTFWLALDLPFTTDTSPIPNAISRLKSLLGAATAALSRPQKQKSAGRKTKETMEVALPKIPRLLSALHSEAWLEGRRPEVREYGCGRRCQGAFPSLSDYCFTTTLLSRAGCPATAAAAPRYLALCAGALCAMPAQATVKVAGSAWLRVQPASAVTTIPSSSAPLPERPLAHALTLACTHIHHQLSPPVLTTRDQVIFSDLLNAFASTHLLECLKSSGQGTDLWKILLRWLWQSPLSVLLVHISRDIDLGDLFEEQAWAAPHRVWHLVEVDQDPGTVTSTSLTAEPSCFCRCWFTKLQMSHTETENYISPKGLHWLWELYEYLG